MSVTLAAPPRPAVVATADSPATAINVRMEEAVCRIVLRDNILADMCLHDDHDTAQFNPRWVDRVYDLLGCEDRTLCKPFLSWRQAEETAARHEERTVRVPRRFAVRYPAFIFGSDGQLEIHR